MRTTRILPAWRGLGLCSALGTRLSECVLCVTCQTSSPPAPHCSRKPRAERHRREAASRQRNGHGPGAPSSADGPARRAGRRARDGEVRKAVPAPGPSEGAGRLASSQVLQHVPRQPPKTYAKSRAARDASRNTPIQMDGFGTPRRTIYFRVELARSAFARQKGATHSLRAPQMLDERLLCAGSAGVSSWPRIWLDLRAGRSRRDAGAAEAFSAPLRRGPRRRGGRCGGSGWFSRLGALLFGSVAADFEKRQVALKAGSRALPVAALRPRPKYVLFDRYAGAHRCLCGV